MKGIKKSWVIGTVAVLLASGVVVYGVTKPMDVPVVEAAPKDVRLFFSEEGFVKDEDVIDVYSLHAGAVVSLYVEEDQLVSAGEPMVQIDTSQLVHDLETAKSTQKGYGSQIDDLSWQEKQTKDELRMSRSKLQGEYETILADERTANESYLSAEITREEQLKLQQIIAEQNEADLRNARDSLQRSEALYAAGAVSQQELDNSRAAVGRLENVLAQSQRQLEIIKSGNAVQSREDYYQSAKKSILSQMKEIDAQLGQPYGQAMKAYYQTLIENSEASIRLLEKQIADCTVKVPATGRITTLNVDNSNVVGTTAPIATVSTGFDALIEVYVPTSEIGSVQVGDTVELELKSEAETVYRGVVTEIDDKAVIQTSSLGVEKRKVKVVVQPAPEDVAHFKAGYDLTVSFTTYRAENVLTVPRTAVTYMDGKPVCWVVADGRLQQRALDVERELKVEYALRGGLIVGEWVVKDAATPGLEDNKSVRAVLR